jgi:DNA-binding HxlR family transcriptional regulator
LVASTANGTEKGARSGAQTLALLAAPLNTLILRALADGPKQQTDLRRLTGAPAQTTLRAQLKKLVDFGAIDKHRRNHFPGTLDYELGPAGRHLLFVVDTLEHWLELAPDGPLQLNDSAARAATLALAEGWSTTVLRALAAGPLSLTQLDRVITSLSYPALERRLATMRLAGLIVARPGAGRRGTPYTVTDWLRRGVAPLAAAARWEIRHRPAESAPIGRLDTETGYLLAVPLLALPPEASGSCRLAAEIHNGKRRDFAGVVIEVKQGGRLGSCTTALSGDHDAWALGTSAAWLDAVIDRDLGGLELGGDKSLSRGLVEGMHSELFRTSGRPPLDVANSIRDDGSD